MNTDVWKVMAGVAADQTLGHWWLGTAGRHLFPMRVSRRVTFTEDMNRAVMVMWPLALAGCVYMGWFAPQRNLSKPATARPPTPPAAAPDNEGEWAEWGAWEARPTTAGTLWPHSV